MSTGIVAHAFETRGAFDPTRTNYFCGSCRSFVQAPPGASAMRQCPTPGCTRPTGFGIYAKVPRPRRGGGSLPSETRSESDTASERGQVAKASGEAESRKITEEPAKGVVGLARDLLFRWLTGVYSRRDGEEQCGEWSK